MARRKTHWNRGLATEAARASLMRSASTRSVCRAAWRSIHPDNGASRRVAQKLGMAEDGPLVHDGEPVVVYRTTGT